MSNDRTLFRRAAPSGSLASRRRGAVAVEAAVLTPLLLLFILGIWQIGRIVQVSQILSGAAAREAARLAAGGTTNGTSVTNAMVQTAALNYLTAAGLPTTAVSNAVVTLTCLAVPSWTDPCNALPLDKFSVTVTIPPGAGFNSLQFSSLANIAGMTQVSTSVTWESLNDSQVTVGTTVPY